MPQQLLIRRRLAAMAALFVLTTSAAGLTRAGEPAWKAAEKINLIPTPQRLILGERSHDVRGFDLVIQPGADLLGNGAREINERIRRLGGEPLSIQTELNGRPAIVLASVESELGQRFAEAARLTPNDPGEQGYVIKFIEQKGRTLVLALGGDQQGAFYAAITLRRLIQPGEDEAPVLREANVRDAPAFKRRSIGKLWFGNEPHPGHYIRWLGRLKINYLDIRGSWVYDAQGERREQVIAGIRQLTDLAGQYGITCKMGFMTDLEGFITDQERKQYGGVSRRGGDRFFSWSAHPVHRRRALVIARFLRDAGVNYMSMHVVDGGGYDDPEEWSRRSEKTREIYGDDHARATADLLNIYRTALEEIHPECEFEAVPYPYHFQFAVPDFGQATEQYIGNMPGQWWTRRMVEAARNPEEANRTAEKLKQFHRGLEKRLPDDVLVTFREGGLPEFEGAQELWPNHPIDIWAYLYRTRAWRGTWEPQDRLIKTWHRPGRRDMFYNALMPYGRAAVRKYIWSASGAEYTWNTDLPDAEAAFTVAHRYYDHGVRNSTDYQRKSLIPRVVYRLWGDSGEAFAGLLSKNVSFFYLADPTDMIGGAHRERFLDPYRYYPEQVAAVRQAQEKINNLVERIDSGKTQGEYDPLQEEPVAYEQAMILYWMTNTAAAKGHVQWQWTRARRLVEQGRPWEAQWTLEQLLKDIPSLRKRLEQVNERIENDQRLAWRPDQRAYRWSGEGLTDFDLAEHDQSIRRQLEKLKSGTRTIPESIVD